MNKMYIKSLLSLVLVVLLVFPTLSLASGSTDVTIKYVYFQDDNGNMVVVNYGEAIGKSMEGDHTLYDGIKEYIGVAEAKGRPLYLETSDGKVLDYRMAMMDNVFKLQDILANGKYEVNREIKCTHELKVVDGVAKIVEIKEIDPEPNPAEIVSIRPVNDIEVEFGTSLTKAISLLESTTTIKDSDEVVHVVDLEWTIEDYNGELEGRYNATGTFVLPKGVSNPTGMSLRVDTMVRVKAQEIDPEPEFLVEVKDIFIGQSQITNNTYANIEIKEEYISVVEAVYVDGRLAINMEEKLSQWRMEVEDGTIVEDLSGRISITVEDDEEEGIKAEFKEDGLLGEGFGLGELVVDTELTTNYKNATQYEAVYTVGSSTVTVTTDMAKLGNSPKDMVQNIKGLNKVSVVLYDADGNKVTTITDVMNK